MEIELYFREGSEFKKHYNNIINIKSKKMEREVFDSNTKSAEPNRVWCGDYGPVCTNRPFDYSYYGAMVITWGDLSNYECYHKLGRGKYSEVFLGYCKPNNLKCVIKVLKPVKLEKIYREIKIL